MFSAGNELARSAVILRCIGEQIQNHVLLHDLCLVSRLFNVEFSRYLYRYVRVTNSQELQALGNAHLLRYTEQISFSGNLPGQEANEGFMKKLLPFMPRLASFSWTGVPLATSTLRSLQEPPKHLNSIHIKYDENTTFTTLGLSIADEPDESDAVSLKNRELFRHQDIAGFVNLEELTIHNMFDDILVWRRQLATTLIKSPGLRKLSLSFATDSIARASHREREEDYSAFFDALCDDYAGMSGAPLALKTLRCGTGLCPSTEAAVRQLVDLSALEEIHLQNEDIAGECLYLQVYDGEGQSEIPFRLFLSSCPNLRGFTAADLQNDVWEALCDMKPEFANQLAVHIEWQQGWDHQLADLLRENDDFANTPIALRMTDLDLARDSNSELPVPKILEALVECNAETLQGLTVHVSPQPYLNDLTNEELVNLMEALPKLTKLTQLGVRFRGQANWDWVSLWARKLSMASSQLQYIGMNQFSWHCEKAPGVSNHGEGVVLHRLGWRERDSVDVFRYMDIDL